MLYCIIFSGAHIYCRLLMEEKQPWSLRKEELVCPHICAAQTMLHT